MSTLRRLRYFDDLGGIAVTSVGLDEEVTVTISDRTKLVNELFKIGSGFGVLPRTRCTPRVIVTLVQYTDFFILRPHNWSDCVALLFLLLSTASLKPKPLCICSWNKSYFVKEPVGFNILSCGLLTEKMFSN